MTTSRPSTEQLTGSPAASTSIRTGDYVKFIHHAPAVVHRGAGYVTWMDDGRVEVDGTVILQPGTNDAMKLVAQQQTLHEPSGSPSADDWNPYWGPWVD